MNRNILLARKNKKKQQQLKKQFQENLKKEKENKPDPNKYNPDVKIKYQENKNIRTNTLKPGTLKIDNSKIIDKKENLADELQKKITERNEKLTINNKPFKKRIYSSSITDYQSQKKTIDELKKLMDEKIKKGKETNNAILSHYQN